jgi:hypothetical protein
MHYFRKILFTVLVALGSSFYSETHAQNFSTSSFPVNSLLTYDFSMHAADTSFAYYYTGGTALLKGVGYATNIIERISHSGTVHKVVNLTSPDFPKPLAAVRFVRLDTTIVAFTVLAKKGEEHALYACELNAKTLEQVNSPVLVFKYTPKSSSLIGGRLPLIITSENNLQVMIATFEGDPLNATTIHGTLLNARLKKVWDKTFVSDKNIEAMLITEIHLTDEGQLLMTGFTGTLSEPAETITNLSKSAFHVFTLELESKYIYDHEIVLDSVNPLNVKAAFLPDGSLICTGMYGKDNNFGSAGGQFSRGVYYMSYAPRSVVPLLKKATPFSVSFIHEAMVEPALIADHPTKGLINLRLKKMIVCSSGSIIILAEHEFSGSDVSPGHHLQELDAVSFLPNGEVHWFKRICKSQVLDDEERNLCSFSAFESHGKILVFYNDNDQNSDDPSDPNQETYKGTKTGKLVCVAVSEKGDMRKTVVIGFNKDTNVPQPLEMHQLDDNTYDCLAVISKLSQTNSILRINCD